MKASKVLILAFSCFTLLSCSKQEEQIVHPSDYSMYVGRGQNEALARLNEEMRFWEQKLSEVHDSETYRVRVGGLLASRFLLTGQIEDIEASDSLYQLVLKTTSKENAAIHRSMAVNCITQHQFRQAYSHIQKALEIGEGKATSLFMMADVCLELGDKAGAKIALRKIATREFFPYLIREAKIKDHEGKLDTAIVLMERALQQVKETPSLFLWTQSNLGDMYGHAGRIKDAYQAYLAVLKQDPDYDYALKGIAWIAFSHDRNYKEAKRIASHIGEKRGTPDMHLFLAQIAAAENNQDEKVKQLDKFTQLATASRYGDMYNKYLSLLEAEELSNPTKAILIAQKEVQNRPTAQSYDLLAWGYFQSGDVKEALSIAREHIENRTSEPDALYHLGMIFHANGFKKEARRYLRKAANSSFELGPVISKKIQERLNS